MQPSAKIRYFDAPAPSASNQPAPKPAKHSEFLRTGRIYRARSTWSPEERRYLTHEEVAERTGQVLQAAAEKSHERINGFHRSIQFPKIIFHRTLDERPHLGYCHVTAARTLLARLPVSWSFYIANFSGQIGEDTFFERISPANGRMYFAVALTGEPGKLQINRSIRKNGVLFQTSDPKEAVKNVLMLGTSSEELREKIKKL